MTKEEFEDAWFDACNAVCQTMQDRDMCKCEKGNCVAAMCEPSRKDYKYHVTERTT